MTLVVFCVIGIGPVAVSTLGAGVGFVGEFLLWFLCSAVFSLSTLGYPPVFTLIGMYMLRCAFLSYLVVTSISLVFLSPFGFARGWVVGLGDVLMNGLNYGERLSALFGPLFFTLGYWYITHRFVSFFSDKY